MRSKHIGRTKSKWRIPFFLALAMVIAVLLLGSAGLFNKKEPVKTVQVAAQPEEKEEVEEQESEPLDIEKTEVDPFEQLIQTAEASIYGIESDLALGTAFLINEKGDLVTNAHIVKGSLTVDVLAVNDDEPVTGTVIGYSEEQDVALIRVEAFEGRLPLRLETEQTVKSGEPVLTFRHKLTEEKPFIKGTLDQEDAEYYVEPYFYQQMLTIEEDMPYTTSGGPLLHEKWGTVIGLSTTRPGADGFVHFHIPAEQFAEQLAEWSDAPLTEEELRLLYEEPAEVIVEEETVEEEIMEEETVETVPETEPDEPSSWSPPSRTTPAPSSGGGGTSAPPASTPSTPVTPPSSEPVEEPEEAEEPAEEVPDESVEEPVEEPIEEEPEEELPEEPTDPDTEE